MAPTIVSYGMGVDSTAVLVGMHQRGETPDLILFADTGSEKPETYAYLPVINEWLAKVGFPLVTIVKNPKPRTHDRSLFEQCHRLSVLPSLAYGKHSCSISWKIKPQHKFLRTWQPAIDAKARGELVTFCVGYDAGKQDSCRQYKAEGKALPGTRNRYPLIEWGWDRARCELEIAAAGLPVPMKSACFFCPASKKTEIDWLAAFHPELAAKAMELESRAVAKGLRSIVGLGGVFRDENRKVWSWTAYLNRNAS